MAKNSNLSDTKALDIKALAQKAHSLKSELADLVLDKNMNKLKDMKVLSKKKKEIAQTLTVLKQKKLLELLESINKKVEAKI